MSSRKERKDRIRAAAQVHFGTRVREISTPGGDGRASCRLHLRDRTVIATLRPNFRRAHLEAFVLSRLSPVCADVPECLGVVGDIIFQSDVGHRRLNVEIAKVGGTRRNALAHSAVDKIFRVQSAARQVGLNQQMPHLGTNAGWIANVTEAVTALELLSDGRAATIDQAALGEALDTPALQFVKWDCRSGNAALDDAESVKWFDFEYAGVRHGAEDLAWLIGDEAWPIAPEKMEEIVRDLAPGHITQSLDSYLDYLSLYVALHCVQRLKLIIKQAKKRGWQSKTKVRTYDDAGVHPEFAGHLCRVGAYFADRQALTRPLARDFEQAAQSFDDMIRQAA